MNKLLLITKLKLEYKIQDFYPLLQNLYEALLLALAD